VLHRQPGVGLITVCNHTRCTVGGQPCSDRTCGSASLCVAFPLPSVVAGGKQPTQTPPPHTPHPTHPLSLSALPSSQHS
jgi:hypothetical protein